VKKPNVSRTEMTHNQRWRHKTEHATALCTAGSLPLRRNWVGCYRLRETSNHRKERDGDKYFGLWGPFHFSPFFQDTRQRITRHGGGSQSRMTHIPFHCSPSQKTSRRITFYRNARIDFKMKHFAGKFWEDSVRVISNERTPRPQS
jgi:hypothetical protein